MDTNKAAGTVQEVAGKVQEAAGNLVGDTATQVAGKGRELGGKAKQLYVDTADIVRDKTTESPFIALAVIGVLGFLLGATWADGRSSSTTRPYPNSYRSGDRY